MGTVTVTVRTGVDTVVDGGGGTTDITDVTGFVTAPTVFAAAAVVGSGGDAASRCWSAAAGVPPAETGSFAGALRRPPCPLTAGRE